MKKFLLKSRFLLIVVLVVSLFYWHASRSAQQRLQELREEERALQKTIESLQLDLDMLQDMYDYSMSSDVIETLAREKLLMVRDDEIIFFIEDLD